MVPFPVIGRYEQTIAVMVGNDPKETDALQKRVHYGYGPVPVIRIANLIASATRIVSRLDPDSDGDVWIMCHRHRDAAESAAYANAALMLMDPGSGLAPAAIEYSTEEGRYTIVTRRPPAGAPGAMIVYSASSTGPHGLHVTTTAIDSSGLTVAPEAYLFAYVPLPE